MERIKGNEIATIGLGLIGHLGRLGLRLLKRFVIITLILLLCGDIHINPGPVKNPCGSCLGPVAKNHWHLICESCGTMVHIKCASVAAREFKERDWSDWDFWKCRMPATSDSFYMDENASITSIDSSEEEEGIEGFCLDQLRDEIQTGN